MAAVALAWEPSKILRRNRLRTVNVRAQLEDGVTAAEVNAALVPWLDGQEWGIGYRYELGGEHESSGKANQSLADMSPAQCFQIAVDAARGIFDKIGARVG